MSRSPRVLICGASPDSVNNNAVLRGYVANGFRSCLTPDNVRVCSLESAEQLLRSFKPNVVVVFGSCMPAMTSYLELRNASWDVDACLTFWLHDDPYEFDVAYKVVPYADVIFSNDRWTTTHYAHPHVYHLPLAADRDSHFREWSPHKDRDVFFCGVGFPNRVALMRDCAESFRGFKVEIAGTDWPSDLPFAANRRVPNVELPDLHAKSLITLNMGRRFNLANARFNLDASTPGPRTFEAAASGTVQCMFVEGLEIDDYFDERAGEILLFDTPGELKRHIESLRDDPARAASIAQAAQRRALRDHTYENRALRILEVAQTCRPDLGFPNPLEDEQSIARETASS